MNMGFYLVGVVTSLNGKSGGDGKYYGNVSLATDTDTHEIRFSSENLFKQLAAVTRLTEQRTFRVRLAKYQEKSYLTDLELMAAVK